MRLTELDKKIMYYLMEQSAPVPIAKLAGLCGVSGNTLRRNIPDLSVRLASRHLRIVISRSEGCYLEKTGGAKKSDHDLQYRINRQRFYEDHYVRDYIIRRLLSAADHIALNDLCEELGYSYSELHRRLEQVSSFLAEFRLTLVTKRSCGLCLEGDEFYKRLCMVFMHKSFHFLSDEEMQREQRFASLFLSPVPQMDLQNIFRKVLEDFPEYRIDFLDIPKVINMGILIVNRSAKDAGLRFDPGIEDRILSTRSSEIAKRYLNALTEYTGIEPDQKKIVCLALVIIGYRSFAHFADIPAKEKERVYAAASELLNKEFRMLSGFLTESEREENTRLLAAVLYSIEQTSRYGIPFDSEKIFPLQETGALSVDLTLQIYHFLRGRMNVTASPAVTYHTEYFCRRLMRIALKRSGQLRVLLYTVYGNLYALNAADIIMNRYANRVKSVTILDSRVNDRLLDPGSFDLLITDASSASVPKNLSVLPSVSLPFLNQTAPVAPLEDWLFERTCAHLSSLSAGRIVHTEFQNETGLYDTLYSLLGGILPLSREELSDSICQRNAVRSPLRMNKSAFLALEQPSEEDVLVVMINRKAIPYSKENVRFFVFYNTGKTGITAFADLNLFLRKFVRMTPRELSDLARTDDSEIIRTILRHSE